jgi:hypothetical protein
MDGLGDIRTRGRESREQGIWVENPGATLADLAIIELRRITDVLQVDHASLFLRDPDDPQRTVVVAETGLPVAEALPEHCPLVSRVLQTATTADLDCGGGSAEKSCAALAAPLLHDGQAVGALLVVTRRASRRLGAIDAQVIQAATETLVERFLAPTDRHEPGVASPRFTRDAPARRR